MGLDADYKLTPASSSLSSRIITRTKHKRVRNITRTGKAAQVIMEIKCRGRKWEQNRRKLCRNE